MKQYKIFKHPSGAIEAVKQGWAWPAFFFSSIWALVKKMWILGVSVFVLFFLLGFVMEAVGSDAGVAIVNVLAIVVNIVFGLQGNAWREKNLVSRGYEYKETINAANPEGATALSLRP